MKVFVLTLVMLLTVGCARNTSDNKLHIVAAYVR